MRPTSLLISVILFSALSIGASADTTASQQPSTCILSSETSRHAVNALCGTLMRPLRDGGKSDLAIHYAVLPKRSARTSDDAILFIAGGPGQSGIDQLLAEPDYFYQLAQHREVIVFDQRGTGRSSVLNCEQNEADMAAIDLTSVVAASMACHASLPLDSRWFTTEEAVADIEALRHKLGYRQLNVIGVSYGTRVAQHYLRRYPSATRSIILDGVIASQQIVGPDHSANLLQALQAHIDRCLATPSCERAFPQLQADWRTYLDIPIDRDLELSANNTTETPLTRRRFDSLLRLYSYQKSTQRLLPLSIHWAATHQWQRLIPQLLLLEKQMQQLLAFGMHNAVICAEDAPFYDSASLQTDSNAPLGDTTAMISAICRHWPVRPVANDFHTPLQSTVPALLLSGSLDPVTPPENAELALQQFPEGQHLVAVGLGHMISNEACFNELVVAFINQPNEPLDAVQCTQQDWSMPYFTSTRGPAE